MELIASAVESNLLTATTNASESIEETDISPAYLKPGFAFGGSCLAKDLCALSYRAKSMNLEFPILTSILQSNEIHIQQAMRLIEDSDTKSILVLGLAFKAGTDDLRESPMLELVQRLLGCGYEIAIYDRFVNLSRLTGANEAFLMEHITHVSQSLIDDIDTATGNAVLIVVGTSDLEFRNIALDAPPKCKVVDFVRVAKQLRSKGNYVGIAWQISRRAGQVRK